MVDLLLQGTSEQKYIFIKVMKFWIEIIKLKTLFIKARLAVIR
jgi:hypothetical protein